MSRIRKRILLERAPPVPEIDHLEEVAEAGRAIAGGLDNFARALDNLARATCVLAVKQEARNPGEQRELGAILWADVVSDFRDVPATEEMRNWLAGLLHIDPKAFPKRPYGR